MDFLEWVIGVLILAVLNVKDVFKGQRLMGEHLIPFSVIVLLEAVRTCGQLCTLKR